MRKFSVVVAAVVSALFCASAATNSAVAQTGVKYIGTKGSQAQWAADGDQVGILDTANDGHHSTVYYYSSADSTVRNLSVYTGYGTSAGRNVNIPETGWMKIRACTMEGSSVVSCSGWSSQLSAD